MRQVASDGDQGLSKLDPIASIASIASIVSIASIAPIAIKHVSSSKKKALLDITSNRDAGIDSFLPEHLRA